MYQVTCSFQNQYRCVSIIPANQIVQSCHLIPKFGTKIGHLWTTENTLDSVNAYYLNPDLHLQDFTLLRYIDPNSS